MGFYPNWAQEIVDYLENEYFAFYWTNFHLDSEQTVLKARVEVSRSAPVGYREWDKMLDDIERNFPVTALINERVSDEYGASIQIFYDPDNLI